MQNQHNVMMQRTAIKQIAITKISELTARIKSVRDASLHGTLFRMLGIKILLILFASTPTLLLGQSTYGTILGTVKDSSGRVVQHAAVILRNLGTTETRKTATDDSGSFTFINLNAGNYEIKIISEGFASQTLTNLLLQARQVEREDVTLSVATQTTTVTVQGESTNVITTDQSTIASTKSGEELNDLPVAIYSRSTGSTSAFSTLTVQPNIQTDGSNLVIAGATPALQSFTIDGISTLNVEYGGPLTELFPSFNAISEIRIGESNNNAEFSGVSDVTTTSRSGTNEYHGGLFDNEENSALNAGDPFALAKPSLHMHDFGAFFGGPASIPRWYDAHDKTFFFASYEGLRLPHQTPILVSVPSNDMRSGNLCSYLSSQGVAQVYDPYGNPIACDAVPVSGVAANTMQYLFPTANYGPASSYQNNYQQNSSTPISSNQGDLRIDQIVNQKQNIFAHATYKYIQGSQSPLTVGSPLLGTVSTPSTNIALTFAHNLLLGGNKANEFRIGFSSSTNAMNFDVNGATLINEVGITGLPQAHSYATAPNFVINGFVNTGGGNASEQRSRNLQLADNFSWILHTHTLKFGVQYQHLKYTDDNVFGSSTLGQYNFNGSSPVGITIGDPFTEFLLGYPDSVGLAQVNDPGMVGIGNSYAFFAQDDWKVNDRLTLNLGLRYELHPPLAGQNDNTAAFLPNYSTVINGEVINGAVALPDQHAIAISEPGFVQSIAPTPLLTAAQAGIPAALRYTNPTDIGPRIGLAWRVFNNDRTVLRAGYGRFIETPLGFSAYTGWAVNTSYFATYNQSYAVSGAPALGFPSPFPSNLFVPGLANFFDVFPLHYIDPYVSQWNVTLEHVLGKEIGVRLSYVGNHGSHLDLQEDLNQVQPNTVGYAVAAADRPYTNWGVLDCVCNDAVSNYNSMTIEVSRHQSATFQFDSSYVYTRDLSNSAGANPSALVGVGGALTTNRFDTRLDYGNVSFDRRHRFLTTFFYTLPFGRGQKILNRQNPVLNAVIDNWQLGGLVLLQSGAFLTPYETSTDPGGTNIQTVVGATRTDTVPGVSQYLHTTIAGVPQYLNPAAFSIPGNNIGRFGDTAVGSVVGPGTENISTSLFKNIYLRKEAKFMIGAEVTNLLNHRNYTNPLMQLDAGGFGSINGLQTAEGAGPRLMELTARFSF